MKQKTNKWFEIFVKEHQQSLFRYLLSMTGDKDFAEEIMQETFIVTYKKVTSGTHIDNFSAWLRSVARNLVMSEKRKSKRLRFVRMQHVQLVLDNLHANEVDSSRDVLKEQINALNMCLKKLKNRIREMLELYYDESLNSREIAERMGQRPDSVRHALSKARNVLLRCVEKKISQVGGA